MAHTIYSRVLQAGTLCTSIFYQFVSILSTSWEMLQRQISVVISLPMIVQPGKTLLLLKRSADYALETISEQTTRSDLQVQARSPPQHPHRHHIHPNT
jgi:hypothetical protein